MSTAYFLIGVPGAGKSTWIKNHPDLQDAVVLSSDRIIDELAENYGYTYDEIFNDVIGFANRVFFDAADALSEEAESDVIIDRTNMSRKSRAALLKKFANFKKIAVVFPTPEKEEWERRLASRPGKTIPKYVLDGMVKNYEEPTIAEGFDEVGLYYAFK